MTKLEFPSRLRPWTRSLAVAALAGAFLALPAQSQFFGKNKVQYREFDWKIYHSPHFEVYHYTESEELLQKVVSFAETAYDEISLLFDYQIEEPTTLIFYETHSHFQQNNIILNFIPEGTGAFATPVRHRMVMPVDLPDPELMGLMKHELTHIFQFHIFFQGNLGKGLAARPPLWFMEGMASYVAQDETTTDRMFLRDAVVNDEVPSITQRGVGGFFAYRFGNAAFRFIEERWSTDGFRDFVYEYRGTIGADVSRAVKRAFRMEPEEFDRDFRRWLRRTYLPQLVATGEPGDFGLPFRREEDRRSLEISPVASPSGDLVAAFRVYRGAVDVVLFDAEKRRPLRTLTPRRTTAYEDPTSQFLTTAPRMGRDLAFSPDGNYLAYFARREGGRSLVLLDVLNGGIHRLIHVEVEQPLAPAWSPDGKTVAFSANRGGRFDIFLLDLATEEVTALTDDAFFNGSPTFAPDGESLVFSSVVGEHAKLFRLDLRDPSRRFQLTFGDHNDKEAVFTQDGRRIYFTSDRNGVDNIYSLDLETGSLEQHTNAVTGCFMPTVLERANGSHELVYTSYWKGRFNLYRTEVEVPVAEPEVVDLGTEVVTLEELPRYVPDIEVLLDEANLEKRPSFRLFLEDADAFIGVTDDRTVLGMSRLTFSDQLGDRRLIALFSSVSTFSNFELAYLDLSRRWERMVRIFDNRTFFLGVDERQRRVERVRTAFRETGAAVQFAYPFNLYRRVELGGGYIFREFGFQQFFFDQETFELIPIIVPRKDDFPFVAAAFVEDTVVFTSFGPLSGRRWRASVSYAPDLSDGGTLTATGVLDWRQYLQISRRTNFALRLYGAASYGNFPQPFFFGGLDTMRGVPFRSMVGDRAFFANFEYRFPLVDLLATPVLAFGGVRSRLFLDIGGAWFDFHDQSFRFWNSEERRLEDAVAAYGYGVTINFLGLDLHWDFAKEWDFKTSADGFRTNFWIGPRF